MTRNRYVTIALSVIAVIAVLYFFFGRGYGKMSPLGYDFAQALYSACNQKDLERVNKVEALIQEYFDKDEIHKQERRWLNSIIHLARKEKWSRAQQEARKLLDAQIEYGQSSTPKPPHKHAGQNSPLVAE